MITGWRVRLARVSLGLTTLAFLGFGLLFLFRPDAIASMGVSLESATARTEIRGFYGGMEIGLGVFFGISLLRPRWFRPALLAQVAAFGGLAMGRIVGVLAEGSAEIVIWFFVAIELAAALLGLVAYLALLGGHSIDDPAQSQAQETR
jgi:hypothetical protein